MPLNLSCVGLASISASASSSGLVLLRPILSVNTQHSILLSPDTHNPCLVNSDCSNMSDVESPQPWQIFCSMFAIFWLVSVWCDHVLISLLLCMLFGVLSEVITKSMYSAQAEGEREEQRPSAEEKKESNEIIWRKAEAELEEEDVPPPLPTKDYTSGHNIDSLADKLQALVDRDEPEEESREEEENHARQYNRTVSDEYNQNTSTVNYNTTESIIEEEGLAQEDDEPDENSEDEEGKIYAKDSSDEDDYDYASREVNFNESETPTDEEDEINLGNDTNKEKAKEKNRDSSDDD